jgi:NADP-dependent 3-hydroxy acid dehydrogenase YdfG
MARQLAAAGARLALLARDEKELAQARQDLATYGPELLLIQADVRHQAEVSEAIERASTRFGRLDVLINNAGVIQVGHLTT